MFPLSPTFGAPDQASYSSPRMSYPHASPRDKRYRHRLHGGVLHPGDALLHSLGVWGPDQVFKGHSESRLQVCIVFVHSPVNTTTLSARTRSRASLGTSPMVRRRGQS
jgi:hypothetical protein